MAVVWLDHGWGWELNSRRGEQLKDESALRRCPVRASKRAYMEYHLHGWILCALSYPLIKRPANYYIVVARCEPGPSFPRGTT